VGFWSDLDGKGVETCRLGTLFPSYESTKEGTTGRAGALTSNEGEGGWVGWKGVEGSERRDESGKTGGGRCEACGGRKVIVGCDVDGECRELENVSQSRE